jgi:hypothetical protein
MSLMHNPKIEYHFLQPFMTLKCGVADNQPYCQFLPPDVTFTPCSIITPTRGSKRKTDRNQLWTQYQNLTGMKVSEK